MTIQSWFGAQTALGNRDSRKIAHATYLRADGEDFVIRQHQTDIIWYYKNGDITLNTDGWFTRTTRDRLEEFTPFSFSGSLMAGHFGGRRCLGPGDENWRDWEIYTQVDSALFEDGITVPADGSLQQHKKEWFEHKMRRAA
jgi:hypothetical protein